MRYLRYAVFLAVSMFAAAVPSHAQGVVVGVGVGPAYYGPPPVCAYGYYPYYPYACTPYGYYGPDYFVGGVFIGAGPWFHGWYGRGRRGDWDRDGWRGRGLHRGWDHDGWRGREFHGDRGFRGEFHGEDRGFRGGNRSFHGGDRAFHGGSGFHGGHGGGRR